MVCSCDDDTSGCVFDKHWPEVDEQLHHWLLEHTEDNVPSKSEIRNFIYKLFTRLIHGYLGKDNRIELPTCVVANVRNKYPNEDGEYVGFISTIIN